MTHLIAALAMAAVTGLAGLGVGATEPDPPSITQEQLALSAQVADFIKVHPKPLEPTSAADLERYSQEMVDYWNAVPWAAVAGQWGCTVDVGMPSLEKLASAVTFRDGTAPAGTTVARMSLITESSCAAGLTDDILRVEPRT